jgi:hypothetical protein
MTEQRRPFSYVLKGKVQAILARLGQFLPDKRYVFEFAGAGFPVRDGQHVLAAYKSIDDIPGDLHRTLLAANAVNDPQLLQRLNEGARLYVLTFTSGEFGCLMFVKSGHDVKRWMIPLEAEDRVIYGAYTNPAKRGFKLWSHLIRHAVLSEQAPGQRWYSDCNIYNASSRTVLLRNGFQIIATKPVPKG